MDKRRWMPLALAAILITLSLSACEIDAANHQRTPSSPVAQASIEGIFYYEITWEPHGWSFLRFFSDGTVINNNTNVGLTPQEAWTDIQSLLTLERARENWHGRYELDGEHLTFTEYPPGSDGPDGGATSECQFTGDSVTVTRFNGSEFHMEYLSFHP